MKKSTFGNRLGEIMQEKGVSRMELKESTGLSLQSISNYLKDKRKPDCEMIAEIAKALNVSADYLLGLSDIPTRNETIRGINEKTGLWESAISALMEDHLYKDCETANFISYLTINKKISNLVGAIKRKNEFSSDSKVLKVDFEGGYYETDMQALFKMIVSDLFFEIIAGYTAKPGEIMLDYKAGESNG